MLPSANSRRARLASLDVFTWNVNLNSEQISTSNVAWADPERQAACANWLDSLAPAHGLVPASLRIASADASFRRYFRIDRIDRAAGSCIIMDAPPEKEDCRPFVHVAKLLRVAGMNAPEVISTNPPQPAVK